jgi:RecA-family ATPase/5S rRNA maturation endonuclease (ribonuclease M5)
MDIDNVLPKLEKVTKTEKGWSARCPAHSDKKPSLSISKGTDGKLLMFCHAGCDFDQIVQALGINEREQFGQKTQKPKIVAVYDYVDENGEVLYEMLRYEPKDFRVRRPNGSGGYYWNFGDVRRVIYQLPEILASREDDFFVVFCEGEKDADNVREKLDLPATTIATGSNAWRDEYADSFFGLNVVILPDNDKPGKAFAKKVANAIYEKAQSVKIVNLPDLEEKGDVSDWIENGGTREQLIRLIDETPEWQLTDETEELNEKSSDFFISKSVREWMEEAMKTPIPKMLFGEFWFEGELNILFADTNAGKSILAVQIADAITKGKQIGSLACEIVPQQVLYFDFELNHRQFGSRYGRNENGYLKDVYPFDDKFTRVAINPDGEWSETDKFEDILFKELEALINVKDAKIVIIDNITYLKNNNEKAREALSLMKRLKQLKEKYGLSVLALAHTPKRSLDKPITNNDLAGSKMLINFCDSAFTIGKSFKDEGIRYVKQIKERNTAKVYGSENVCIAQIIKDENFLCFDFLGFGDETEHLSAPTKTKRQEEIDQAVALKNEGKTQRQIADIMGKSVGTVNGLLKEGESQNSPSENDVHFVQNSETMNKMNTLNLEDFPF